MVVGLLKVWRQVFSQREVEGVEKRIVGRGAAIVASDNLAGGYGDVVARGRMNLSTTGPFTVFLVNNSPRCDCGNRWK